MKDLARIEALYDKVDSLLETERVSTAGPMVGKIEADQVGNDQACFLLCWGQLETEIDTVCRAAIKRNAKDPDWRTRRSWYLYNPDDTRLSGLTFEDRAALVLDRTAGPGTTHANAMACYETRNTIAHGRLR